MLPADGGCIVDNVDTIYNIYQAVKFHKPLTERIVTVSGDGIKNPCNLEVPFGTMHQLIVDEAGGMNEKIQKNFIWWSYDGAGNVQFGCSCYKGSSAYLRLKTIRLHMLQ